MKPCESIMNPYELIWIHYESLWKVSIRFHYESMWIHYESIWIRYESIWIVMNPLWFHMNPLWTILNPFEHMPLAGRIHQGRIHGSRWTNSSSKISQDEFIGLRVHPAWSRRTNSSGYEFIGLRIHRATKSSSKNPRFSLDEFDGLRIRQATNSSGDEFIKLDLAWRIHRATNSSGYELDGLRIYQVRVSKINRGLRWTADSGCKRQLPQRMRILWSLLEFRMLNQLLGNRQKL